MSAKVMNCPHCGRILPKEFWYEAPRKVIIKCPRCGSTRTIKASKRYTALGAIQRYYCNECGRSFSSSLTGSL